MKPKLRKILAMCLAVCVMAVTFISGVALPVSAATLTESYYTYEIVDGGAVIADVDQNISGDIVIPDTLGGYPVTSIGDSAFKDCESLASVEIPHSVTSIDWYAFASCDSLTRVVIPNSVTDIGQEAFSYCTKLNDISLSDSIEYIGAYAFSKSGYFNDFSNWDGDVLYLDKHLIATLPTLSGEYTVKSGTKSISPSSFYNCDLLESIIIPDSVTYIGGDAFSSCDNLSKIKLPKNLSYISGDFIDGTAFYNNNSNWENGILYIDNYLINTKTSLRDAIIKDGTTYIAAFAFSHNSIITFVNSVTIPDSVTYIGDGAFAGCDEMISINMPKSLEYLGKNAFASCNKLTSITVPSGIDTIKEYTFRYCHNLIKVELPEGITSIEKYAFSHCNNLRSISIPFSVKSIGEEAFTSNYLNVYYGGTKESWEKIQIVTKVYYSNNEEYATNEALTNATMHYFEVNYDNSNLTINNIKLGTAAEILGTTVKNAKGEILDSNALIGTGCTIEKDGKEYTVIITGEVNGDGKVNSTDFMQIRKQYLNLYSMDSAQLAAADVNGDGKINSTDFMQVRRHFLGLFDIYA